MSANAYMGNVDANEDYTSTGKGCLTCYLPESLVAKLTRQNRDVVYLAPSFHANTITLRSVDRSDNGRSVSRPKNGFCIVQFGHTVFPLAVSKYTKFGKSPTRLEHTSNFTSVTITVPPEDQQLPIGRRKRLAKRAQMSLSEAAETDKPATTELYQLPILEPVTNIVIMAEVGADTEVFNIPVTSYESFKRLFGKYRLEI